jgi:hypothetical protein
VIPIKQAVQTAYDFFDSLYSQPRPSGILLEEVKLTEDEKEWHVVLGFDRPRMTFDFGNQQEPERAYKLIIIDAQTGQPKSLTIYEP